MTTLTLLFIVIGLALFFDFINGFHDAANSIATIVSTKVLSPFQAVLWAAAFNVIAFWIFKLAVADTVSKTVIPDVITPHVILAGLIGAIFWNLLTWWMGIPSSSSHTLMGGFAGAAIAAGGFAVVNWHNVWPVMAFIFLAPVIGMLMSYFISAILLWTCRKGKPHQLDGWFKRFQLLSSALFSLGHGGNDAQKVMGILLAGFISFSNISGGKLKDGTVIEIDSKKMVDGTLKDVKWKTVIDSTVVDSKMEGAPEWLVKFNGEYLKERAINKDQKKKWEAEIKKYKDEGKKVPAELEAKKPKISYTPLLPPWVPICCYFAIGFGTLFGGWRIVKTMGTKITKVTPFEGVAAETAGAITLFGTAGLGIPVSTTHTITGAIIGVGLTKRVSAVRWGVTINLLWAWVLTIPVSALVSAGVYNILIRVL